MRSWIVVAALVLLFACSERQPLPEDEQSDLCRLTPDPGPCKANFPKYYFNQQEKACKEFSWGGCNGIIPFESLAQCQRACMTIAPTPTPEGDPKWLQTLIQRESSNPVADPPVIISRCEYKNQTVYYVPPRCCDIPSKLYSYDGDILCYPGGGFKGMGDGQCSDFQKEKRNCNIVWEDKRT